MDERTSGVMVAEPERLEREIEDIRTDLTGVLGELDRRRHELLDWRLQLRRHRRGLTIALGVLLLVTAGGLALAAWRRRRRQRLVARAGWLRALVVDRLRPEPPPEPGIGKKVLAAGLSAAAGTVAKALAKRALHTVDER